MAMSLLDKFFGRKRGAEPEPESESELTDHRAADRQGTYKVVSVTYPSGYQRRGVIVDMSKTGLRIRFSQRGELPGQVSLKIEGMAGTHTASTVWQETYEAGLKLDA